MIDISFTGGNIEVRAGDHSTVISEFSDDGTPVECNDIEVTGNAVTLNGQLILWRKPVAYTVAVTVIPGSDNDETLNQMLQEAKVEYQGGGSVYATAVDKLTAELTINCPEINQSSGDVIKTGRVYNFSYGRILSGPTGPSSDAEGKMSSRTYTFVFERMARLDEGKGFNVRTS